MTSNARLISPVNLRWYHWHELDPDTLYRFLKLRSDIFVVEQNCVFSEMDGLDPACEHLVGKNAEGRVLACLRLVPPGVKVEYPAIGRLVVAVEARGTGLARAACVEGLRHCAERFPGQAVFLAGQHHLEPFYASLGFRATGGIYLDGGIPHVNMLRQAD